MSKLIAIDDGHGMTTAGKRTPFFPGTKRFMHENEFNRAVADLLKVNLERCGFDTIMVAPGDSDVPLKTRTDRANKANADFYISIHANAITGKWGSGASGIETFYCEGSTKGKRLAGIVQKHLLQGTKQVNRGIKTASLHVVRETNMPAILVEAGFMDDCREAQLLNCNIFRDECAVDIAKGICEYFDVKYIPEKIVSEKIYRVQVGAYSDQKNALTVRARLKSLGYESIIV